MAPVLVRATTGFSKHASVAMAALASLFVALAMGAAIGETAIEFNVVLKTIANRVWDAGFELTALDENIIWHYRLSRAVVAACCGASLALAGLVLQTLLRNPLADPYILGISAGASSGAVAVALLGLGVGILSLPLGAFIGALVAFGFVLLLSWKAGHRSGAIILAGVAGSQLFHALTSFMVTKAADAEQARGIMFWLLGNLSGIRWEDAWLTIPVCLIGMLIFVWHARALDAFTFGAESAASLGINVKRVSIFLILCAALMTATMVALMGSIGFVGLVIPHIARMIVGIGHMRLLLTSALLGGIFLIFSDILSRTLVPGQVLPIGVVTALFGAPVFAFILAQRSKK